MPKKISLQCKKVLTKAEVSYVEAKRMGFSSLETKFLITCLMVSVESTVEIPSLLPSKEARVLFPVPDVPASKTRIFLLDSKVIIRSVN